MGTWILSARFRPDLGSVPSSKVTVVPTSRGDPGSSLRMSSLWAKTSPVSDAQESQPQGSFHEVTRPSTRSVKATAGASAMTWIRSARGLELLGSVPTSKLTWAPLLSTPKTISSE